MSLVVCLKNSYFEVLKLHTSTVSVFGDKVFTKGNSEKMTSVG